MFQLIYASTATQPFDEEALRTLVQHARQKNKGLGITGMLVHRNGSFLHVLEGEEEAVRRLYDTIRTDDRHQWVTLLKTAALEERDFYGTPLAFRDRSVTGVRQPLLDGDDGAPQHNGLFAEGVADETLLQFQDSDGRPPAIDDPAPGKSQPRGDGDSGSAAEAVAS